MPLKMRGSVSARLSVRFSAVSAARNALRSLARTSIPPGSMERSASFARSGHAAMHGAWCPLR